jgi:hypothetical protein
VTKPCAQHVGPIIHPCTACGQPWLAHSWGPGDAATRYELPTICERCGQVVEEVTLVDLLVCRQTHWEPAEYETQAWCPRCIAHAKFMEEEER